MNSMAHKEQQQMRLKGLLFTVCQGAESTSGTRRKRKKEKQTPVHASRTCIQVAEAEAQASYRQQAGSVLVTRRVLCLQTSGSISLEVTDCWRKTNLFFLCRCPFCSRGHSSSHRVVDVPGFTASQQKLLHPSCLAKAGFLQTHPTLLGVGGSCCCLLTLFFPSK